MLYDIVLAVVTVHVLGDFLGMIKIGISINLETMNRFSQLSCFPELLNGAMQKVKC